MKTLADVEHLITPETMRQLGAWSRGFADKVCALILAGVPPDVTTKRYMEDRAETIGLLAKDLSEHFPIADPVLLVNIIGIGNIPALKQTEDIIEAEFDDEWEREATPKKDKKPAERVSENHLTIHEMITMRDFREMAKPPTDLMQWDPDDLLLLRQGVRAGQIWDVRTPSARIILCPIGYHNRGFVWIHSRNDRNILPHFSAVKAISEHKKNLIKVLKSGDAMLFAAPLSRFLDEAGFPLPGREVDVALTPFSLKPIFWHDPTKGKNFFVSFCEDSHYVFSDKPLPVGCPCGPDCNSSKHTEAADSMFEALLYTAMRYEAGTIDYLTFTQTTIDSKARAFAPYLRMLSYHEGRRLTKAFSSEEIKWPTWIKRGTHPYDDTFSRTTKIFQAEEIKSGDIFPLNVEETNERIFAKAHRRACGFFHFELSSTIVFSGTTDWRLVSELLRYQILILGTPFEKNGFLRLSTDMPVLRCPVCKSRDPLLILYTKEEAPYTEKGKYIKRLSPLTPEAIKRAYVPSKGEIISAGKTLCIVDQSNDVASFITAFDRTGKKLSLHPKNVRILDRESKELKDIFFDKDGLLKKPGLGLTNWTKIFIAGCKLIARRGPLAGQEVTCTSTPFKMGADWHVRIAESGPTMSLLTDLSMHRSFPLPEGTFFRLDGNWKIYQIKQTENGVTTIFQAETGQTIRVPKIALDILRGRGILTIQRKTSPLSIAAEEGLISTAEAARLALVDFKQRRAKKAEFPRRIAFPGVYIDEPEVYPIEFERL